MSVVNRVPLIEPAEITGSRQARPPMRAKYRRTTDSLV
jgi:hypothetical protein